MEAKKSKRDTEWEEDKHEEKGRQGEQEVIKERTEGVTKRKRQKQQKKKMEEETGEDVPGDKCAERGEDVTGGERDPGGGDERRKEGEEKHHHQE